MMTMTMISSINVKPACLAACIVSCLRTILLLEKWTVTWMRPAPLPQQPVATG